MSDATLRNARRIAKVEYQYTVQTKEGAAGAKPKFEWDIKKGKGSVS